MGQVVQCFLCRKRQEKWKEIIQKLLFDDVSIFVYDVFCLHICVFCCIFVRLFCILDGEV